MTPEQLENHLAARGLALDDRSLLATVEARADAAPADGAARRLVETVHAWWTADAGLPPVVSGVTRSELVRWDARTTTWTGPRVDGSGAGMVRVLRPSVARDPVWSRQLRREGEALRHALPDLRFDTSPLPALSVPLPGPAFVTGPRGGHAGTGALVGLLARTTTSLAARERAGVGFAEPDAGELRDADTHLAWICLTAFDDADPAAVIAAVAIALRSWWDPGTSDALTDVLEALVAAPPRSMEDAADHLRATLATVLAARRHAIALTARNRTRLDRRDRLEDLVERLAAIAVPPAGHGAVGVDLEGQTLVITSRLGQVTFGPQGAQAILADHDGSLDAPLTRRLLRARAGAPISERLNDEVGGDPVFVERIVRWASAALQLRTIRLLLSLPSGGDRR